MGREYYVKGHIISRYAVIFLTVEETKGGGVKLEILETVTCHANCPHCLQPDPK